MRLKTIAELQKLDIEELEFLEEELQYYQQKVTAVLKYKKAKREE